MHQALPYKTWHTMAINFPRSSPIGIPTNSSHPTVVKGRKSMKSLVDENAVIVFGRRDCCMSHVVRRLLLGLGVNPAAYEVDEQDEQSVIDELEKLKPESRDSGCGMNFPTVFIGGRRFGGLDRLMAAHISGELTPILKEAGALWL